MSLFSTFNVAKRGMQTHQTALEVTSHNMANADTDGYSMQRAEIKTTTPFGMPSLNSAAGPGQIGTGSEVTTVTRARDQYLDAQIRKETSTQGKYQSRETFLEEVQAMYNENSTTGLSSTMTAFWDAWNQLNSTPESSTARTQVANEGADLATAINHLYQQLSDLNANAASESKKECFDVASDLAQIKDLNAQIKAVTVSGMTPNDLMDKRDNLIDDLSAKFSIDVTNTDYNGVKITAKVNGQTTTIIDSNDSSGDLSMAYVSSINYYINSTGADANAYDTGDITVKTLDSNNLPSSIQYGVAPMDIDRDSSGKTNSIIVDGVKMYDYNDSGAPATANPNVGAVSFGDGTNVTANTTSRIRINDQVLRVDSTGKLTLDGSSDTLTADANGVVTDTTTGKVLFNGIKIPLDASASPANSKFQKSISVNGDILTISKGIDNPAINTLKLNGTEVKVDNNGVVTDKSTGKVLLNGMKINMDSYTNPTDFTGYQYMNNTMTLTEDSITHEFDSARLNSLGTQVYFDSSNNINVGSNKFSETLLDNSSNVSAEAVLNMNGDSNQVMKIENIPLNKLSTYTDSHTLMFNKANYESYRQGKAIFSAQYSFGASGMFDFQATNFDNGSLCGNDSVNEEVSKYQEQLNNLARTIAIAVNTIHSNDGQSINFFNSEAETSSEPAKVLSVNSNIISDNSKINAYKTIGGNTGNGERALLIQQLRNVRMDVLNVTDRSSFKKDVNLVMNTTSTMSMTSSPTGTTLDGYYNNTISTLGVDTQEAQRMVTNQQSLIDQLDTRKEGISGVSLDEEMTNMVQFEKGYQANAKMISTIDNLLDVVINGLIK